MKNLFALALLGFTSYASANPCYQFVGKYACYLPASGISFTAQVSRDGENNVMSFKHPDSEFSTLYPIDGKWNVIATEYSSPYPDKVKLKCDENKILEQRVTIEAETGEIVTPVTYYYFVKTPVGMNRMIPSNTGEELNYSCVKQL